MVQFRKKILDVFDVAEKRLRQLIVEAAEAGDYDGIDTARSAAGFIREIARQIGTADELPNEYADGAVDSTSNVGVTPPTRRDVKRKRKAADYPKFYVENGLLYKVGWSKKDSEEYVHKVPKDAYERVIRTIGDLARNGRRLFTSEQVAEDLDRQGSSVPVYQVYLTLALLREREFVQKKGREGYRANNDIVARGIQLWSEL